MMVALVDHGMIELSTLSGMIWFKRFQVPESAGRCPTRLNEKTTAHLYSRAIGTWRSPRLVGLRLAWQGST